LQYNLIFILAVGINPENLIHALAVALIPGENNICGAGSASISQDFDDTLPPQYAIVSDRDKWLLQTVSSRLAGAYHAMCCQNIAENMHKKFRKSHSCSAFPIKYSTRVQNFPMVK
jgi:hypothetical protein